MDLKELEAADLKVHLPRVMTVLRKVVFSPPEVLLRLMAALFRGIEATRHVPLISSLFQFIPNLSSLSVNELAKALSDPKFTSSEQMHVVARFISAFKLLERISPSQLFLLTKSSLLSPLTSVNLSPTQSNLASPSSSPSDSHTSTASASLGTSSISPPQSPDQRSSLDAAKSWLEQAHLAANTWFSQLAALRPQLSGAPFHAKMEYLEGLKINTELMSFFADILDEEVPYPQEVRKRRVRTTDDEDTEEMELEHHAEEKDILVLLSSWLPGDIDVLVSLFCLAFEQLLTLRDLWLKIEPDAKQSEKTREEKQKRRDQGKESLPSTTQALAASLSSPSSPEAKRVKILSEAEDGKEKEKEKESAKHVTLHKSSSFPSALPGASSIPFMTTLSFFPQVSGSSHSDTAASSGIPITSLLSSVTHDVCQLPDLSDSLLMDMITGPSIPPTSNHDTSLTSPTSQSPNTMTYTSHMSTVSQGIIPASPPPSSLTHIMTPEVKPDNDNIWPTDAAFENISETLFTTSLDGAELRDKSVYTADKRTKEALYGDPLSHLRDEHSPFHELSSTAQGLSFYSPFSSPYLTSVPSSTSSSASSSSSSTSPHMPPATLTPSSLSHPNMFTSLGTSHFSSPSTIAPSLLNPSLSLNPSFIEQHSMSMSNLFSSHVTSSTAPESSSLVPSLSLLFPSGETDDKASTSLNAQSVQKKESLYSHYSSSAIPAIPQSSSFTHFPVSPAYQPKPTSSHETAVVDQGSNSLLTSSARESVFRLVIVRQPPDKTVYQRILRPFPVVSLSFVRPTSSSSSLPLSEDEGLASSISTPPTSGMQNLFVEVCLVKADSDEELSTDLLDGNKVERMTTGSAATFKKLKINCTSQQMGCMFRLRFQLKKYVGNGFLILDEATVCSDPIQVFSHTSYLMEKSNCPAPPMPNPSKVSSSSSSSLTGRTVAQSSPSPMVMEIIPASGKRTSNQRCAIIGANFVKSPHLAIYFGAIRVTAEFHEQGTLLCYAPDMSSYPLQEAQITVTNDGCVVGPSQTVFKLED